MGLQLFTEEKEKDINVQRESITHLTEELQSVKNELKNKEENILTLQSDIDTRTGLVAEIEASLKQSVIEKEDQQSKLSAMEHDKLTQESDFRDTISNLQSELTQKEAD